MNRIVWLSLLGGVACAIGIGALANRAETHALPAGGQPDPAQAPRGLVFRLSESEAESPAAVRTPDTPSRPLDVAATARLLSRVPALADLDADRQPFAIRENSLPPPRTGKTLAAAFPPASSGPPAVVPPEGPLRVTRRAPEGAVPIAPNLSVTFSEPMVAVTAHDDPALRQAPVTLSPQLPGQWRWVGTKTVLFEPAVRFPMATDFTVSIPAGVRSATGSTLDRAVQWTFSTPPPTVTTSYPTDIVASRTPVLLVVFDQRIDAARVLETIGVRAAGTRSRLRLATKEEIDRDERAKAIVARAEHGRWLAVKPEAPLAPDAAVTVTVGPGTPSAEGPATAATAQTWGFHTFGRLRVVGQECGWQGLCPPSARWTIRFSNPLSDRLFKKDQVRVDPPIRGVSTAVYGDRLMISGESAGRTTYRVTLAAGLTDAFDQTLEDAATVTFDVTAALPSLSAPGGALVVLDPASPPRFPVYSVNYRTLNVSVHAVTPGDWPKFRTVLQESVRGRQPLVLPGRRVSSLSVSVVSRPDEVVETGIGLAPALRNGLGHAVISVEAGDFAPGISDDIVRPGSGRVLAWVQATRIGLDAFSDNGRLVAWATGLEDGRPLAGVEVRLEAGGGTQATGRNGVAEVPLTASASGVLVARLGEDTAILPDDTSPWRRGGEGGWQRVPQPETLRWCVIDDRHLYKPGEEVRIKGWIRVLGSGPTGDLRGLGDEAKRITYRLMDALRNEVHRGTAELGPFGSFDLAVKLPPVMNLGDAHLELEAEAKAAAGRSHHHFFQVQEFRRPEFEVATIASDGPHLVSSHATVTAHAAYLAGGSLASADVEWSVRSTPRSFSPPGRSDFVFGTWVPWWESWSAHGEASQAQRWSGVTDESGNHRLRIDLDRITPPRPVTLTAEATITDVNRQAWSSETTLLVHPSRLYVGLRRSRLFVQRGDPIRVEAIVTDLDGRAVAGRAVSVRAERLDWVQEAGQWRETAVDRQECALESADTALPCSFKTPEGGTYRVSAAVTDDQGRPNESEVRIWVAGGRTPPRRNVEQEAVTLVPDKESYGPGDVAEFLVVPPFTPAEGLLTLRRSGIVRSERFVVSGPSHTLRIKVEESWTPNVHVQVDVVGAASRTDDQGVPDAALPRRPAFASGSLDVSIRPVHRTLKVEATPRARALEPGGQTVVDIALRDSAGQPVAGGEVAVIVVDEAVLSLTAYQHPNPVDKLYLRHADGTRDFHSRASVVLARQRVPEITGGGPGVEFRTTKGAVAESVMVTAAAPMVQTVLEPAVRVRSDFNALAVFAPGVRTDADGRVEVPVTVPDNLTRYRIVALAATQGVQFGIGESTLTARLPLMVRASPPRFLNFGDRAELPVVLQNQTDERLAVDVAVRAANASLLDSRGRQVIVAANQRVEVRFPVAADLAGTARFQVVAASGRFGDASRFDLPVWTPATTEAFATYGQIDQGAIAQPVRAPKGAVPAFGGLEITMSSTALQALTDAVVYLVSYPFECSEQLASRLMSIAALRDVLAAFEARGLPPPGELLASVTRDIERLARLQNDDGGFPFWRRGDESWPYLGIHAAHALQRAKAKGFAVPEEVLGRSQQYLRSIGEHIPATYGAEARQALLAYALYVRSMGGDADVAAARAMVGQGGINSLPVEAAAWLLAVLSGDRASGAEVRALRAHLSNRVTETASGAQFTVSYGDSDYLLLHSSRRTDAVVLDALIADQPASDLIPKLVEGLLGHRTAGRWSSTQENVFVLLALDRYFSTYEKATPDFVARVWLGDGYAGEHAFRGRSTERYHVSIPMALVAAGQGATSLVVSKEGGGRLYYRVGMQYAPASLTLAPADHGFTVERTYQAVDDAGDVSRDADGTWRFRAGARVRVKLTMVAPERRYHVALVDPLPAGLEPLNPSLATTGAIPRENEGPAARTGAPVSRPAGRGESAWWWWRPWFDHQNLRDERVEAFASLLWDGVHTYSYVARATTPGTYVVPPPHAEEMYHPETFGRGSTARVVVGTGAIAGQTRAATVPNR